MLVQVGAAAAAPAAVAPSAAAKARKKKNSFFETASLLGARLITHCAFRFFCVEEGRSFCGRRANTPSRMSRSGGGGGSKRGGSDGPSNGRGGGGGSGKNPDILKREVRTPTTLFLLSSGEACLKALPGKILARHTRATASVLRTRISTVVMGTGGRGWGDWKRTSNLRVIFYRCF